ncbi:hypothetical protein ACTXT7_004271 [Hymenolepis weldensis]
MRDSPLPFSASGPSLAIKKLTYPVLLETAAHNKCFPAVSYMWMWISSLLSCEHRFVIGRITYHHGSSWKPSPFVPFLPMVVYKASVFHSMPFLITVLRTPDESVDVFGPFTIEELQQYRSALQHKVHFLQNPTRLKYTGLPLWRLVSHPVGFALTMVTQFPTVDKKGSHAPTWSAERESEENLSPAGESVSRVPLNASDRDLAESLPLIRNILSQTDNSSTSSKFSHPPAAAALPQPTPSATADGISEVLRNEFCSQNIGILLNASKAFSFSYQHSKQVIVFVIVADWFNQSKKVIVELQVLDLLPAGLDGH